MPCMFACHAIECSGGGDARVGAAAGWDLVVGDGRVGGEDCCKEDCEWEEED
jgi:hypothetical protein